ncbi:MAG TPA: hypothetical protein VLF19_09160 [Methylomirabilota bacterium]|nr:hypothetical protein [Methylomirabilota bacterium]
MRRAAMAVLAALALVAGAAGLAPGQALRVGAPAPDVAGAPWINSASLTIQELRGRVVLVEFWTYG